MFKNVYKRLCLNIYNAFIMMHEHKAPVQKHGIITPVSHHFQGEGHNHKHDILCARMVYTKV